MKTITPIIMIMTLFLVGIVSSELQTLGVFKQSEAINLVQNCLTSSYSNITRIVYPNGTFALNSQTLMTKNGDDYSYAFSNTGTLGQYIVYGSCDESGTKINWVYDFSVTATGGLENNSIIFLFLILIAASILVISFIFKNYVFATISGFALMGAGMYGMIYGFADITSLYTRMISYIIIGLGMIIAVTSGFELASETYGSDSGYKGEDDD